MGNLIDKIKLEAEKQTKELKEMELSEKINSIILDFQKIAGILRSNHLTNCSILPMGSQLIACILIDSKGCVTLEWESGCEPNKDKEEEHFSESPDLSRRLIKLEKQGLDVTSEIRHILSDKNCIFKIN